MPKYPVLSQKNWNALSYFKALCGDKVARQCQTTQRGIIKMAAARLSF
jgi:hypothetical protein